MSKAQDSMSSISIRNGAHLPELQLMSNGSYHVMVTREGAGYSRWRALAATRWHEDAARDGLGYFCYLRDNATGSIWSSKAQPITAALLSAEISAVTGHDPGTLYADLAAQLGSPVARLVEAGATAAQKRRLAAVSPQQVTSTELAGEKIESVLTTAPGNGAAIGGLKVSAASGWFAARPSGTEDIYKIYAESFRSAEHLQTILQEAQAMVDLAIGTE